ncbi:MAG: PIN domain nuclease [Proteobacteria bacterium]|nr:PIN domain nuclease [Pseudomonadota bacterium]
MILADSSVWIDYFNGIATVHTDTLDMKLDDGEVVMGDLILLEILQGFRSNRDYNRARTTLAVLDQYEMFGLDMVVKCADNYRGLRKKGITIRKTVDVIIATFCIENKFPLLYSDRDFTPFVENMGLKILKET